MGNPSTPAGLTDRAQHLLKVLIERYVADGQPVGSRTLSRGSGLDLSAATIRNAMADLEDMGFVASPHTSAGRVPTAKGYRLFVDCLMTVKPIQRRDVESLRGQLDPDRGTAELMQSASKMLSSVTQMAGLVMMPRRDLVSLQQIEFLPMSGRRVLAVLVLNDREVQNRIIHTQRDFSPGELQQAANYINARCAGRNLRQIRRHLLADLDAVRRSMNELAEDVVQVAEQVFDDETGGDDYAVSGQTNLMGFAELSNMEKLRQLFDAFGEKRDMLHLLDQCAGADGVQIFIGEESGYRPLDECSVVTAPYQVDGQVLGVLGVVGPTRMAYERVVPIVDVTARLLSSVLNFRS